MTLSLECVRGADIARVVPHVAVLRIAVFREFPYLYEGTDAYERKYLQTYVDSADSLFVIARDGERVIGASSALPLADETHELRAPWEEHGYDVSKIFYCGESVLLPAYRGRGLGVRFFEEREGHARKLGRFEQVCFCAVQRPSDHPRRPRDYTPLDAFWKRRGYAPHPEMITSLSWRDLDEDSESDKPMMFWSKRLEK